MGCPTLWARGELAAGACAPVLGRAAVARVRASKTGPKQVELDVSTHGEQEATASGLGTEYVEDYAPMAKVCCEFADVELLCVSSCGVIVGRIMWWRT